MQVVAIRLHGFMDRNTVNKGKGDGINKVYWKLICKQKVF